LAEFRHRKRVIGRSRLPIDWLGSRTGNSTKTRYAAPGCSAIALVAKPLGRPHSRAIALGQAFPLAFRFIHTADLHLDAPLKAMALRDPDLAREIGTASRLAFSRLIDLCIAQRVAFLLIAGDLWDGTYSSTKTPRFLKTELLRLEAAGIRCFLIRGNHDALARQTGELDLPANSHLFGAKAGSVTLELDGQRVAIHGLSFRDPHAHENPVPRFPAPLPGCFNIGMLHTSLNGSPGHDPYAPCSLADLEAQGYNYWALGHIHRRAVYRGRCDVVMPGIPQGRDIGEAGPCSVTLVHVDDDATVTLEERSTACLTFDWLHLDCSGVADWAALLALVEQGLRQCGARARSSDHLVLRLVLTGSTLLAWRMRRDIDRLTEEAASYAKAHGLWIDKIKIEARAEDAKLPGSGSLPADLVQLVLHDLAADPALAAALLAAAQSFQQDLPPDLRDLLGDDPATLAAHCHALLAEGAPAILSRLAEEAN
jgi:DNA repair protein SbcD/Mre11